MKNIIPIPGPKGDNGDNGKDGRNGSDCDIEKLNKDKTSNNSNGVVIGSINIFSVDKLSDEYIECDGRLLSRS